MQLHLFHTSLLHGRIYKGQKLLILLIFAAFVFASELQADSSDLYFLPRTGGLVIGLNDIEDIRIIGVVVGLRVDNALYIESELNTSVSGGKYLSAGEKGKLVVHNFNIYGAYRYVFSKRYYGKLKAGIAYKSLEYDISNNAEYENTESGYSATAGLGIGIVYFVHTTPAMIEFEYANIDKNIEIFTIGITIPF